MTTIVHHELNIHIHVYMGYITSYTLIAVYI